jgi:hypothetical protein
MTENDIVSLDSLRRDVDRDVIEMLKDGDKEVRIMEWWDLLGLDKDKTVMEVRGLGVTEGDGVHLTSRANRVDAISLCHRVMEVEMVSDEYRGSMEMGRAKRW